MSTLNPLNDLTRKYLDTVAKMNKNEEETEVKRWEGELNLQMKTQAALANESKDESSEEEEEDRRKDDDLAGAPNKNGKNGKKKKRWWDDDGDGKGYEKGEVKEAIGEGDPQDDAVKQYVKFSSKKRPKAVKKVKEDAQYGYDSKGRSKNPADVEKRKRKEDKLFGAPLKKEETANYVESYVTHLDKLTGIKEGAPGHNPGSGEKSVSRTKKWMEKKGQKGAPGLDAMKAREAEHRAQNKSRNEEVEYDELDEAERTLADRLARKRELYKKTTRKAMDDARRTGEASGHNRFRMGSLDREMDKMKDKMNKESMQHRRNPEGSIKDRFKSRQTDPSKDNFTGIGDSIEDIMKQNAAMKKAAAKKKAVKEAKMATYKYDDKFYKAIKKDDKETPKITPKSMLKVKKEGFSSWRDDLREIVSAHPITDVESEKEVTEKKGIKNKVIINPKMSEAVAQIGGQVISETEVDLQEKKDKDTPDQVKAVIAYDRARHATDDATYDTLHGKKKQAKKERDYAKWQRDTGARDAQKSGHPWKHEKYGTREKEGKKSVKHAHVKDSYDPLYNEGVVSKEVKELQKAGKTLKDKDVVKADKTDTPNYKGNKFGVKETKDWIQGAVKRPGAFTRKAKAAGQSVQQFAKTVDDNPSKYSTRTKRQANLAQTFASMKKEDVQELFYTLVENHEDA